MFTEMRRIYTQKFCRKIISIGILKTVFNKPIGFFKLNFRIFYLISK